MSNIIVHDRRLEGKSPSGAIQVNGRFRLGWLLNELSTKGKQGKHNQLIIMCHSGDGAGLQLCKESLTLANVNSMQVLAGLFDRITLYACEAALTYVGSVDNTSKAGNMTRQDNRGTLRDGQMFCRCLSAHTGAVVVASDTTQIYSHGSGESLFGIQYTEEEIDFGGWEGGLWEFHPDQSVRKLQ